MTPQKNLLVRSEQKVIETKNDMLEAKITALTMVIELLKKELQHKEEIIALHNYYMKMRTVE